MLTYGTFLWIIPGFPALGALLIFLFSLRMSPKAAGALACSAMLLCFGAVLGYSSFLTSLSGIAVFHQKHWTWLHAGTIQADFGFYFDRLSMVFCLIVSGVGFLIHLFSVSYMRGDEGERRYFGYMNLFAASMLLLVMADNGFLMFLGWEGVGACSFFLIGHWYEKKANVIAALKAFYVTRLGDIFLLLGLILLAGVGIVGWNQLELLPKLPATISFAGIGGKSTLLAVAGLLLLGGAVGKSAQLPLQVWLPDAMAGPTPVSALIHAATMVTAGVYLIARYHILFCLSPAVMEVVAFIGVATAFYGATCAMVQTDIKRVLAYSTISQIGYMVLALGVGAFSLGVFHFFTHGFFKALLFLGAGAVIHALGGEQNMYNMGGLKDRLRPVFWPFLAGAASLAGIPLITAGFFSKDAIIWASLSTKNGGWWLFGAATVTAFLTSVYSFRMVYLVFFNPPTKDVHVHPPDGLLTWPLYILAVFAIAAGYLNVPAAWHVQPLFQSFLSRVFGAWELHPRPELEDKELLTTLLSAAIAIVGAVVAWYLYGPERRIVPAPGMDIHDVENESPAPYGSVLANSLFHGWRFDAVYGFFFVRTFRRFASVSAWVDRVVVDGLFESIAAVIRGAHGAFVGLHNGRATRYAVVMLFGAALITSILISLYARTF